MAPLCLALLPAPVSAGGTPGGEQAASERAASGQRALRERLEHEFDGLHALVEFELDNCKAAVSLWQVSQAIGKRGRDFLDGSAERVTACMARGRRESARRSEQLLARLPEEGDFFRFLDRYLHGLLPTSLSWGDVRRALADYMASVDATFRDVAPRLMSDGFENGDSYSHRLDRMEETLNLKALKVRDEIAKH